MHDLLAQQLNNSVVADGNPFEARPLYLHHHSVFSLSSKESLELIMKTMIIFGALQEALKRLPHARQLKLSYVATLKVFCRWHRLGIIIYNKLESEII